jgi:hypothetical protein
VTCTVSYTGGSSDRPDIRLQVFLANVNVAFADTPSSAAPFAENLAMLDGNGAAPPNQGSPYGEWSKAGSPPLVPTMTWVAQGGGEVLTYTGRLQNAADMNHRATITVPLPAPPCYLSRLPAPANPPCPANTNPNIAWFLSNQWYSQTFFAVSPDFLPGGGGNCVSNPPCLTVKNLSAPLSTGQAILILAGRSLNGTARPSANPKDYLEGENCNLTPGKDLDVGSSTCTFWADSLKPNDNVYEHRAGAPTAINDRVVVVSPP